jgi:sulfonate transport system permease protein
VTRVAGIVWLLASVTFSGMLVYGWQLIADNKLISPVFLPGPDRAWAALLDGFSQGTLQHQLYKTVDRMFYGWLVASVAGIILGGLIGSFRWARQCVAPTLEFIRPLPASAVAPVAIAFFGLSSPMIVVLIGFGSLWPVLLATIHGFSAVDSRLVDVGRALGLTRMAFVWKVALPNAVPDILAGMRFGLTVALILSVVGEMLTGQDGLGTRILLAARAFRAPDLYSGIILLGLIGLISNSMLALVERRLLRWRPA